MKTKTKILIGAGALGALYLFTRSSSSTSSDMLILPSKPIAKTFSGLGSLESELGCGSLR